MCETVVCRQPKSESCSPATAAKSSRRKKIAAALSCTAALLAALRSGRSRRAAIASELGVSAELERSDGRRSCHVAAATGAEFGRRSRIHCACSSAAFGSGSVLQSTSTAENPIVQPGPARYFRARQPSGRASCRAKIAGPGLPVVSARHHIAGLFIHGSQICNSPIERFRLLPDVIPQASIGRRILSPSSPARCLRPSSPNAFERPHTSPIVVRPDFSYQVTRASHCPRISSAPILLRPRFQLQVPRASPCPPLGPMAGRLLSKLPPSVGKILWGEKWSSTLASATPPFIYRPHASYRKKHNVLQKLSSKYGRLMYGDKWIWRQKFFVPRNANEIKKGLYQINADRYFANLRGADIPGGRDKLQGKVKEAHKYVELIVDTAKLFTIPLQTIAVGLTSTIVITSFLKEHNRPGTIVKAVDKMAASARAEYDSHETPDSGEELHKNTGSSDIK
ncbi:uncharacterized protein LOC124652017 [Lolium rigidum]|uniref:uncharacterized protein LOC124652017 n=1 Tax=Lolium rigidum TaxID=89674 RepID=UPI001F5CF9FF|nr:uncharacterized protein LOC124652017 [Lolium rigidum]